MYCIDVTNELEPQSNVKKLKGVDLLSFVDDNPTVCNSNRVNVRSLKPKKEVSHKINFKH